MVAATTGSCKQLLLAAVMVAALSGSDAAGLRGASGARRDLTAEKISFSEPSREAFRGQFDISKFIFDLGALQSGQTGFTEAGGGQARSMNVDNFPALFGEGMSFTMFNLQPCGINLPHVHPRATEVQLVTSAGQEGIQTAFIEENGIRPGGVMNTVHQGQVSLFPRGLVHYQMNMSCEPATMISALNNEDPGVLTITSTALKGLPQEGLAASLGISNDQLQAILGGVPDGPAAGSEECRKRCGLLH